MNRTGIVTVFALGLALVATAAAGGAAGTTAQANASANASFGAEVSSFMQASSAEAPAEVEDGIFSIALNRTDDPEERKRLIEDRVAALQEREQRLEARQEALNDSEGVARYAIATEVAVSAAELEESATGTERAAEAAGLNTTALAEIRANASEMHGRAVAEIAGGIAGPPADEVGPSADVPGGEDGNSSASDRSGGPSGNASDAPGGDEGNDGGGASDGDGAAGDDSDAAPADGEDSDDA